MTENAEQYRSRLAGYVEGKDAVAVQRESPRAIAQLIEHVPPEALKRPPAPGKWSATQIIMHLAEDELVSSWRYRQMLEYDDAQLAGFDQDLWASLGDYASCEPAEALQLFRLLREANLRMFTRLTPEQWQRCGTHSERGKLTVRDLCLHMAAHDINHIEQIRRIVASATPENS
ncbi:MAG TPA: DinB family protein [Terriglobales bacterium]|nr:DinB family protein [Terriglobales bacterium]